MDRYYVGRVASSVFIDECGMVIDEGLRNIAQKMKAEVVPKIQSMIFDECKYRKERQIESNDWRRKGKRGFNGYHRYV